MVNLPFLANLKMFVLVGHTFSGHSKITVPRRAGLPAYCCSSLANRGVCDPAFWVSQESSLQILNPSIPFSLQYTTFRYGFMLKAAKKEK